MCTKIKETEIFIEIFYIWSSIFVFAFLPMDILYRIDSMIRYAKPFSIIVDTCLMIVLLVIIAAVISSGVIFVVIVASKIFIKIESGTILSFNCTSAALFLSYIFYKISKNWVYRIVASNYNWKPMDTLYKIVLIAIIIVYAYIKREPITKLIIKEIKILKKPIKYMTVISIAIICYKTIPAVIGSRDNKIHVNSAVDNNNKKPNIILITMDALSAEDMSIYNYTLNTTPAIDKFAHESYVFDNMFSNSNWTRPAVASLLMGVRPSVHRLISRSNFNNNTDENYIYKNLPNYLRENNYNCYAIIGNASYAHPSANDTYRAFSATPYDTVEKEYVDNYKKAYKLYYFSSYLKIINSSANLWLSDIIYEYFPMLNRSIKSFFMVNEWATKTPYPAEIPTDIVEKYLHGKKCNNFIWIHLYPPHDPYLPPNGYKGKFLKEKIFENFNTAAVVSHDRYFTKYEQNKINKLRLRYDEYILYADSAFGEFITFLKKNDYYDNAIILFTADHGESFAHGYLGHGGPYLYQQLIHIPLIIHMPSQKNGERLYSNVEQVDIAPTILNLAGLEIPPWFDGESMKSAMYDGYISKRPKYSMDLEGNGSKGRLRKGNIAVVQGDFKYVYHLATNSGELYNIKTDPQETVNISINEQSRAQSLKTLIMKNILQQ